MRNLYFALIALASFALFSCGPTYVVQDPNPAPAPAPSQPPPPQPAPEASYQNFYDALSPYGEWIDNPEYGYVWMPNVGPDFKPYATNGNWVYTEEGWAWNSDYSWGWAPFHYGRWFFQDGYGWMWIPGNEWAPAWVTWRRSPDYYGWAPLGPSVSINVAVNGGYNPPPHYWNFVAPQYVASQHVNNYFVNEQQNTTIVNNTTVIRNTTVVNNTYNNTTIVNNNVNNSRVTVNNYAGGPDPAEVSRASGNQIRPVAVRESNAPEANRAQGMFSVFRPRINAAPQNNSAAPKPAPPRVQQLNNVRPVNPRVYNNNHGGFNNTNINNTNNTSINNTSINNNTTNTNINNNNTTNSNTTNNNYNNFNRQPANQPANQGQFNRPANQPANPEPFNRPGNQPANTRFVPGASTNNGNPAVTNPAVTNPAVTNPSLTNHPVVTPAPTPTPVVTGGNPAAPNNRLPSAGADNGNGNGYRNNGNGNANGNPNGNGLRINGNGNGRGNAGNGNGRPAPPAPTVNQARPRILPAPKPKDTAKPHNPNNRP